MCCRQSKCIAEPLFLANKDKVQDKFGNTALMLASELGHVACVDFLLKAGVKKDAQNHIGGTALMLASSGSLEGVH